MRVESIAETRAESEALSRCLSKQLTRTMTLAARGTRADGSGGWELVDASPAPVLLNVRIELRDGMREVQGLGRGAQGGRGEALDAHVRRGWSCAGGAWPGLDRGLKAPSACF